MKLSTSSKIVGVYDDFRERACDGQVFFKTEEHVSIRKKVISTQG